MAIPNPSAAPRSRGRDLRLAPVDRAAQEKWRASDWKPIVSRFQRSCAVRATWQLSSTLTLYASVWVLLYFAIAYSWWLALPLVVLGAGLLVRVFIIFHDTTHGSFYQSRRANDVVGAVTGLLTFTPYKHWRGEHVIHHGANGDLDRRGIGDIWTMTVNEYLESSKWRRCTYRIARNPIALFVVAPFVLFFVMHRFSRKGAPIVERRSVWMNNLGLCFMALGMSAIFGFVPYLILQAAIMMGAGAIGIWLFYLQHQFEEVYWERTKDWNYTAAALSGSSFLRLPKVLQWFSGNIGFHHIHHLSPRIPNYYLEQCHASHPMFESAPMMTFWSSFRSLRLRLLDEASRRLVTWRQLRKLRQAAPR